MRTEEKKETEYQGKESGERTEILPRRQKVCMYGLSSSRDPPHPSMTN